MVNLVESPRTSEEAFWATIDNDRKKLYRDTPFYTSYPEVYLLKYLEKEVPS